MRSQLLVVLVISLSGFGCAKEEDDPYTRGVNGPGEVHLTPDGHFVRYTDDAAAMDAAEVDAEGDAAADMAVVDAAVDLGPDGPIPMCTVDEDCTRAILLEECDVCPVPMTRDEISRRPCVVDYVVGQALSLYEPLDCHQACPADTPEFCDGRIFAVRCGPEGVCENIP